MPVLSVKRPLRLGIVGLGRMGMRHWHTWQQLDNVELVAICDPDPQVRQWASRQQLPCYTDVAQLGCNIDIAVVASPSSTHHQCTLGLLTNRIACLVEKPLALGSEECRQLLGCARQNAVLLAVGQCERFNPGVIQALQALKHSPTSLEVFRHASHAAPPDSDVIDDLLVHDLDWLLHSGQRLCASEVLTSRWGGAKLQAISCRLDFVSGLQVCVSAGYETLRRREVLISSGTAAGRISLEWQPVPGQADPLRLQALAFLAALQSCSSPIATAEQALQVTQLCEQLRQQERDKALARAYCDA